MYRNAYVPFVLLSISHLALIVMTFQKREIFETNDSKKCTTFLKIAEPRKKWCYSINFVFHVLGMRYGVQICLPMFSKSECPSPKNFWGVHFIFPFDVIQKFQTEIWNGPPQIFLEGHSDLLNMGNYPQFTFLKLSNQ